MLQFDQVALRRGTKQLFEQVSFQVHNGQRVGLVGANGSGKSSLFALLNNELETDSGAVSLPQNTRLATVRQESPSGQQSAIDYVLAGDQMLCQLRAELAVAEQQRAHELARIHQQLENIDGYSAEARAAKLLHGLGFNSADIRRPVGEFSGGWRVRLNLAQALMAPSDLLLLDEPTNHLDLPAIIWLEQWLKRYPGMLMLISHDREFLDAACTHILAIEQQRIKHYPGNYTAYENLRAAQLSQQQALHLKQAKQKQHLQHFVDRFRAKASKAKQAQSRIKMLQRMLEVGPAHLQTPFHFTFPVATKLPQHMLALKNAAIGYGQPLLDNCSMTITLGDRIGLLGANGQGKSTFMKALADSSTLISGERSTSKDCAIGYFAQHQLEQLIPTNSALQHLQLTAPKASEQQLRDYLGGFNFHADQVLAPIEPFSGGEKARLVLALLIYQRPNLLLLDEPTNHLDIEMREALALALQSFTGALLLISHDRHLLDSCCDKLYLIQEHRLIDFKDDLDTYTQTLRNPSEPAKETANKESRKTKRQQDAHKRALLKPHTQRIKKIEAELEQCEKQISLLQQELADESLYTNIERKKDLENLLKQQASDKARQKQLENDWLLAQEALDDASRQIKA